MKLVHPTITKTYLKLFQSNFYSTQKNMSRNLLVWILDSVELLDPMAEVQKESEVEKEKPAENSTDENAALLTKLLSNPETAALLKALAKTI